MKKFIILGITALLLLGGGAGAYFFLLAPKDDSTIATAEAETENSHAAEEKNSKKSKKPKFLGGAHTAFMELPPLVLPLISDDGIEQTITLNVAVEIESIDQYLAVKYLQPKLISELLQDTYSILEHPSVIRDGKLQVPIVRKRLHTITDAILGEENVHDVLIKMHEQRNI